MVLPPHPLHFPRHRSRVPRSLLQPRMFPPPRFPLLFPPFSPLNPFLLPLTIRSVPPCPTWIWSSPHPFFTSFPSYQTIPCNCVSDYLSEMILVDLSFSFSPYNFLSCIMSTSSPKTLSVVIEMNFLSPFSSLGQLHAPLLVPLCRYYAPPRQLSSPCTFDPPLSSLASFRTQEIPKMVPLPPFWRRPSFFPRSNFQMCQI